MSYFVTEDHCRIYYEDRGPKDAQCIVFVHGGGCNRFFYKKNVPVLAKKFRVLSYDQRCHGDSDKPEYGTYFARMARDLRELLEALDMHKVVLVGHSMGMDVIWQYIKDYGQEDVAGIVVYEMSAKLMNEGDWTRGTMDAKGVLDYFAMQGGHFDDAGFYWSAKAMFGEGEVDEKDVEWTIEQMKSSGCPLGVYIQCCTSDYREVVPTITVPVLVTHGKWASLYAEDVSQWIVDNTGGYARKVGFEGGHFCCYQDADNWNREVAHFLENEI